MRAHGQLPHVNGHHGNDHVHLLHNVFIIIIARVNTANYNYYIPASNYYYLRFSFNLLDNYVHIHFLLHYWIMVDDNGFLLNDHDRGRESLLQSVQ